MTKKKKKTKKIDERQSRRPRLPVQPIRKTGKVGCPAGQQEGKKRIPWSLVGRKKRTTSRVDL